jgi:hypothetical protein
MWTKTIFTAPASDRSNTKAHLLGGGPFLWSSGGAGLGGVPHSFIEVGSNPRSLDTLNPPQSLAPPRFYPPTKDSVQCLPPQNAGDPDRDLRESSRHTQVPTSPRTQEPLNKPSPGQKNQPEKTISRAQKIKAPRQCRGALTIHDSNQWLKKSESALASRVEGRPINQESTARAASRPSEMAQTTKDCPRRMSPAAKTISTEDW